MPNPAPVAIVLGLPGYDSIRQITGRFAESRGSILTSTNNAALVHARSLVLEHADGRFKFEDSEIEIKGLGELARVFCEFCDVQVAPVASSEVQAAVASVASASLPPVSPFYDSRELAGFHDALTSTLQELRRYRISSRALEKVGPKTEAVASLVDAFESALSDHRLTTLSHRLEDIVSSAPAGPNGLRHVFWIGETEWPPLMFDFVRWIAAAGIRVTVLAERHPTDDTFYAGSKELVAQLPQATVEVLAQEATPHAGVFGARRLEPSNVQIVHMPDAVVECERAVSHAMELDCTIYSRSVQEYAPYLYAAATRAGLRMNIEIQQPLLDNAFARHFLDAVTAVSAGSIESTARLALSSYSGIPHKRREDVYSTVRMSLRSGDPWGDLESGIDGVPLWFAQLAEWRRNALDSDKTLTDWVLQLKQLTSRMPWLDASVAVESETKERDLAAQDSMIRSLEVSKISADPRRRMSLSEFARHLDEVWRRAHCWSRERGDVQVVRSPWEIGDANVLTAVGLVEGRFPKRRAEDPLLLDVDRRQLSLPDSYRKAEEESREFHRLACSAERLILTYPETFDEGEQVESSFLDDIGGVRSAVTLERRFPTPADARCAADLLAAESWYGTDPDVSVAVVEREQISVAVENSRIDRIESDDVASRLHVLPRPLVARHLRALTRCAFQYLCGAKLGLRQNRNTAAWGQLAEVVRRTNLGDCPNVEILKQKLRESLLAQIEEMRGRIEEDELVVLSVAGPRALDEFAEREFAAREVWGTIPTRQNVSLQDAGFRTTIPTPAGEVVFDETIDVLYRRGDDSMPLRFAYVSPSTEEEVFFEDVSLLFAMNPSADKERLAAIDSLETGTRRAIARLKQSREADLRSAAHRGLRSTTSIESAKSALDWIAAHLKQQIHIATKGDFRPTPGEHCERCRFAPLCRSARNARLVANEQTEAIE